jgi:tRNA(Ile)-lysidine synthase
MGNRPDEEVDAVLRAAASVLNARERVVLAVSGGLDSMVLLDSVAAVNGATTSVLVATFDHRTGPHSARAVRAVQRAAGLRGLGCVVGVAAERSARESEWRDERWRFLRSTAQHFAAAVTTAHTLDDQIETVFMRILRDAGPRGLAGLYADSGVLRPFVDLRKSRLEAYAAARGVRYVQDPSNESRAHLRNRVRHELLPALTRARPSFPSSLLTVARMAAVWRDELEQAVAHIDVTPGPGGSIRVARSHLSGYDVESLRTVWPAIAARAGVVMDRRGTHRVAEFTMKGRTGGSIQLSGGIEVRMFRDHLLLRKWDASRVEMIRASRHSLVGDLPQTRVELA